MVRGWFHHGSYCDTLVITFVVRLNQAHILAMRTLVDSFFFDQALTLAFLLFQNLDLDAQAQPSKWSLGAPMPQWTSGGGGNKKKDGFLRWAPFSLDYKMLSLENT